MRRHPGGLKSGGILPFKFPALVGREFTWRGISRSIAALHRRDITLWGTDRLHRRKLHVLRVGGGDRRALVELWLHVRGRSVLSGKGRGTSSTVRHRRGPGVSRWIRR
jgi:hypothetical protein